MQLQKHEVLKNHKMKGGAVLPANYKTKKYLQVTLSLSMSVDIIVNNQKDKKKIEKKIKIIMLCVLCHLLPVKFPMSRVTCHMSTFIFSFF